MDISNVTFIIYLMEIENAVRSAFIHNIMLSIRLSNNKLHGFITWKQAVLYGLQWANCALTLLVCTDTHMALKAQYWKRKNAGLQQKSSSLDDHVALTLYSTPVPCKNQDTLPLHVHTQSWVVRVKVRVRGVLGLGRRLVILQQYKDR